MRRTKHERRLSTSIRYTDPWKVYVDDLIGDDMGAGFHFTSFPLSLQPLGLLLKKADGEFGLDLKIYFTYEYEFGGRRDSEGGLVPSYSRIHINDVDVTIKGIPKSVDPNLFISGIRKFLNIVILTKEMRASPGFNNIMRMPELKNFELKNFVAVNLAMSVDMLRSKANYDGIIAELKGVVDIAAADLFKVVDGDGGSYDLLITSKKYLGMVHDDLRISDDFGNEL